MNPTIAIIDYGMGNLRSVQKALARVGADAHSISEPRGAAAADGLVLPGVGAFAQAMEHLSQAGFDGLVREWVQARRPFLGICLGLQLLFTESSEHGQHEGLGVIPGQVVRFQVDLKVPHMGWNEVCQAAASPLFEGIDDRRFFYFAHSYYAVPAEAGVVIGTTDYGLSYASAVQKGNVFATQFHPEKSGPTGLRMLGNFCRLCRAARRPGGR